jgi:hypothetical protein
LNVRGAAAWTARAAHGKELLMGTFFLAAIILGVVIGSAVYIALMNHIWWKKKENGEE